MAIKVNKSGVGAYEVINDSRRLDLRHGSIGLGADSTSTLLAEPSASLTVGDTTFNTDKEEIVVWNGSGWVRPNGNILTDAVNGTGGNFTATPGNGYKYHTFTSPGTFSLPSAGTVDILVVGAGGGSRYFNDSRNGGGGGGGVAYWPNVTLPGTTYPVTVGSGGAGLNGGDSTFAPGNPVYSVVGKGGGRAGGGPRSNQTNGNNGGSGGGGSGFNQNTNSGSGIQNTLNPGRTGLLNYGNDGGPNRPGVTSEGGGGAGQAGNSSTATYGGKGGDGIQVASGAFAGNLIGIPGINPYSGYYGGGGDGNSSGNTTRPLGGGGAMTTSSVIADGVGQDGVDYTGGGASGGGSSGQGVSAAGGDGIVVIRYEA